MDLSTLWVVENGTREGEKGVDVHCMYKVACLSHPKYGVGAFLACLVPRSGLFPPHFPRFRRFNAS